MDFLHKFAASLPKNIIFEDLYSLQPQTLWEMSPQLAAANALALSGHFDAEKYLRTNPDVEFERYDPVTHFITRGMAESREFPVHATDVETLKTTPYVSVLIPIFNNLHYLRECIDSVVNQTLKNIEIILINDGSTDAGVLPVLREYTASDKRITLINKRNTGYGHSMNIGLDTARGEYIGLVEADDYIEPDMYESLYAIASKTQVDIVKCDLTEFKGHGSERQHWLCNVADYRQYNKIIGHDIDPLIFYKINFLGTYSAIYKRNFLKVNNIKYSETPGAAYQDISFWFKTIALANTQYYHNKFFYHLRRDNEASSVLDNRKLLPVCYENRVIKQLIHTHPALIRLHKLYQNHFFSSYRWRYNKAEPELKQNFGKRFLSDLYELFFSGKFVPQAFSSEQNTMIKDMINSSYQQSAIIYLPEAADYTSESLARKLSSILKSFNYSIFFIINKNHLLSGDFYGEVVINEPGNQQLQTLVKMCDVIFVWNNNRLIIDTFIKNCLEYYAYKMFLCLSQEIDEISCPLDQLPDCEVENFSRWRAVLCRTEEIRQNLITRFGYSENLFTVSDFVDSIAIERANDLSRPEKPGEYILYAGPLGNCGFDGLDLLIPAFLNSTISQNIGLVIAGPGELDSQLQAYVEMHPRGRKIRIIKIADTAQSGLYRRARFFVSLGKRYAPTVLEALTSGTPALVTEAAGNGVVIEGINGQIIRNADCITARKSLETMLAVCDSLQPNCHFSADKYERKRITAVYKKLLMPPAPVASPKISVIIPVYNAGQWLEECLRSVCSQSLKELEILCIDDGSTDNSAAVIKSFPDVRIKYFHQKNSGSGSARNLGLKKAKGEFVAFLDSDDLLIERQSYRVLYDNAKALGVAASGGRFRHITSDGKLGMYDPGLMFIDHGLVAYEDWQYDFCYQAFIFKRQLLMDKEIAFPDYLRYQDPVFFVKAMHAAGKFATSAITAYYYCTRLNKAGWKWNVRMAVDYLHGCLDNLIFARNHNLKKLRQHTLRHKAIYTKYFQHIKLEPEVALAIQKFQSAASDGQIAG